MSEEQATRNQPHIWSPPRKSLAATLLILLIAVGATAFFLKAGICRRSRLAWRRRKTPTYAEEPLSSHLR